MADKNVKTYQTKKGLVIKVDRVKCISCGTCSALAPKTFELDSEMISVVKEGSLDSLNDIQQAVLSCPVEAISVELAKEEK